MQKLAWNNQIQKKHSFRLHPIVFCGGGDLRCERRFRGRLRRPDDRAREEEEREREKIPLCVWQQQFEPGRRGKRIESVGGEEYELQGKKESKNRVNQHFLTVAKWVLINQLLRIENMSQRCKLDDFDILWDRVCRRTVSRTCQLKTVFI